MELFFYTLIAYHNTGYTPDRGHTVLQFGRGRNSHQGENITQACHSSFFSAFVDNSPKTQSCESGNEFQHSLLTGTHLLNSLSSTVELPGFVNKLDDELETTCKCRETGLNILQQVSLGHISPIDGMNQFFKMMEKAFSDIETMSSFPKRCSYLLKDTQILND